MRLTTTTTRPALFELLALFFASLILFTWGLSQQEIIGFDSRFYLFAQEMWRQGVNWFPTTYQQPYADYPATSTLLIYLVAKAVGGLNKWVAVLPTAIAASLTVTLTYCIGALQRKQWGWLAALFMLLTFAFIKNARAISLDMFTTLITTACFYLIHAKRREDLLAVLRWVLPLLFLAFVFRGPIGLVMPTGVISVYYLLDGQFKRLFITGFLALGLLILCTVLLLALAYHVGGYEFLDDVLRMEVLGRIENSYLPRYFYFTDGMLNYALSLPLACLVMIGVAYYAIKTRKLTPEFALLVKLAGWIAVILLGMSIPGDKKIRYVLPMVPAAALLAAYPFIATKKENYFVFLRQVMLAFFAILPSIFIAVLALLITYANKKAVYIDLPYSYVFVFLGVVQVLNAVVFYLYVHRPASLANALLLIAALNFSLINIVVVEPVEIYLERASEFVQTIEKERLHAGARLAFYRERPDSLPIKYLINMPQAEPPVFVENEAALLQFSQPAFFVTSQTYFDALPKEVAAKFRLVAKNTLGHVKVVVFTQR